MKYLNSTNNSSYKFAKWVGRYSEKISLFHVILLSFLFALISIVNMQGGILHQEMCIRLPFYLSDTPLINKIFDSQIVDGDMYQARELSYVLDFIDCKFVEFSVEQGFPHFLSITHYLFSIAIGCVLWLFCLKALNLKPLISLGLFVLFWTSPSIILGENIYRTGKISVALLAAILFYVIYKIVVISKEEKDFQISKKVWVLYVAAIFSIPYLDQQGAFLAIATFVFFAIWMFFVRQRNVYIMFLICAASIILHVLYRYLIAPQLTFMLNGYWPNFNYQTLPLGTFFKNIDYYLSAGFFLYLDTFRFLIGNPPRILGIGILLFCIIFPVFYLYKQPGLSAKYRKLFIVALVDLLITNLLLIIMNALMVLRHPPVMLPNMIITYYWLPTNVIIVMMLAILMDIFCKAKIPQWLVLMMLCCAITGNIVEIPKHNYTIQQGENKLYSQLSSKVLSELKNSDSLDDVQDPLIQQNPVLQFFKTKHNKPPVSASAYKAKGIFYLERGQYRKAINNLNKAIMMNPHDIQSLTQRGNVYFFLLQYEKGIEDLSEVIRLKPDDAEIYKYRGYAYFIQGKNDLGCRDAQKACELGSCRLLEKVKDEGRCL